MATGREQAKELLRGRAAAYRRVFLNKGADTDIVLKDLSKFCRASVTTFHADPRIHAVLEGRREVWLRISHMLNLSDDAMWSLYGNHGLPDELPKE